MPFGLIDREMTIGQLAEILGLSRATVTRLCTTLAKYDYLRKDLESKKYSLASGCLISAVLFLIPFP